MKTDSQNPSSAMISHAITVYTQDYHLRGRGEHHRRRWEAARQRLIDWDILK